MNLGAEPKKVAILGTLLLIGGYSFYSNVLSTPGPGGSSSPPRPRSAPVATAPAVTPPTAGGPSLAPPPQRTPLARVRGNTSEFRPSLKPRTGENRVDPTTIDPTLRLDLLAKVQGVDPHGGNRNLFQFGAAPPPPAPTGPEPKIIPSAAADARARQAELRAAVPAGPPPPPPIPLKYYGYSTQKGEARKRAFFLDGDEILVAGEGDTVKRRYRVVRIGVNSVIMEDTEHKSQQTLPLTEDVVG